MLPTLRRGFGDAVEIDLLTCYPGAPKGFEGRIFRIGDYTGAAGRDRLLADLAPQDYRLAGMICAAEPIMTKWKWWLAARMKAKFFILNENGDYFWFDWHHRHMIAKFAAYRAGLTGSAAVPALARFLMFPLTLAYLILSACTVHPRRKMRMS